MVLSWQVTIVTNNAPAASGEGSEARCQGDMEKADMVDGEMTPMFSPNKSNKVWSCFLLCVCVSVCPCVCGCLCVPVCVRVSPRYQRERKLDPASGGEPQQDLRVPGPVRTLHGPADAARCVSMLAR